VLLFKDKTLEPPKTLKTPKKKKIVARRTRRNSKKDTKEKYFWGGAFCWISRTTVYWWIRWQLMAACC